MRAINEQVILEAILADGTVTRAGLARRTGLSKPTVSALVSTLEARGLVNRQGPKSGKVGRPATLYTINGRAGHAFAVDLGGTKLRAAITDLFGDILVEVTVSSPRGSAAAVVDTIGELCEELTDKAVVEPAAVAAVCIGVPGVVRRADQRIESAFNLPELDHLPFLDAIEERLRVPGLVENDVNLAAVGERWRGLGRGCDHFVSISIGTGIGMGIVLDGELYRGAGGAAGEVGFLPVAGDPFDSANRTRGPLENAAASGGIERRLRRLLPDRPATRLTATSSVRDVFTGAAEGDAFANELVDDEARLIALGIAVVCSVLDPQLVVLGGGIGANPILLSPVRGYLADLVPEPPEVQTSSLGEHASLYGAIALAVHLVRQGLLPSRSGDHRHDGSE